MPISGTRRMMMRGWGKPPVDVKDAGLVLYLPLWYPDSETTGGTIISKDKYRYSCTATNTTWGFQGRTVTGTGYIELTATNLNFTTGAFSYKVWAKTTDLTNHNVLVCRGLSNTDGYLFFVSSAGEIAFYTYQAAAGQASTSSGNAILVNTWSLIGVTRDGTSCRVYKNGVDVTDTVGTHTNPATSTRTVKLGIYDDKAASPLIGTLGEVACSSRADSAADHMRYYMLTKWRYGK